MFDKNSALNIFDVGSCEGEDSIKYSRLFPKARIFAVEPFPENQKKIIRNIKFYNMDNIRLVPAAFSEKSGYENFYISSGQPAGVNGKNNWDYGNKSSSLLKPDQVKCIYPWLKFNGVIKVKTDTIENFCAKNNVKGIDFLHLDVQGAELSVLKGAGKILDSIKAIWLEAENVALYAGQPS